MTDQYTTETTTTRARGTRAIRRAGAALAVVALALGFTTISATAAQAYVPACVALSGNTPYISQAGIVTQTGLVYVKNNCQATLRIKVDVQYGFDSPCRTIAKGQKIGVPYTSYPGLAYATARGVYTC
ncbi:hypothetical protein [Curtobacterium caseinilyticum]|uniref:Uncharacterized protein n=1 Tax=Curtobacterium caseinilyticum TaxID=3055137 RepID=A0ABT7TSQ0_9MICO|nr:hypothetical protein [Curtobacterium caseinilyticum]MDM7892632.1 hypothetical protein [Curtobacterium caseinilyticum]